MERSISAFCEEGPVPNQHLPAVCFTSAGPSRPTAELGRERASPPSQSSCQQDWGRELWSSCGGQKHWSTKINSPQGLSGGNHPPYPRGRLGVLGLCLIMVLRKAKGRHPWREINPKAQPHFAAHQRGSFRRSGNANRGTQRPHWALALLPWCSFCGFKWIGTPRKAGVRRGGERKWGWRNTGGILLKLDYFRHSSSKANKA